ncbi:hypothetical protein CCAX7_12610 [Capsulimonas corticalis]|uniref:DNA-3-methyladenine glycosylase II n=1 Tax=Capsulimonas corticalis TaxID=2219043 RepID=A0A402D4B8_9BACT|nr:AlkA N-terminal domain-containing protein [Capsulimonas corticalis]BDI29210.1 hypothetical protein CCAX7_12610 [Capsulimonas corticalis]
MITANDNFLCELTFQPPYDWNALLRFLDSHATAGVEMVSNGVYYRTVVLGGAHGWIGVRPSEDSAALRVEASPTLAPIRSELMLDLRRQFDLDAEPDVIAKALGALAAPRPGLRIPGGFEPFELAARAILGQQISVRAATTVAGRFAAAYGAAAETPIPGLTHNFPSAEKVASLSVDQVASLGIIASRTRTILGLARAVSEGAISLAYGADPLETMARMRELPGIGEWTAQYVAMRALGWRDAFPHTDLVLCKALGEKNPKRVLALAERWRPWRSYAALHLWAEFHSSQETP